MIKKLIAGFALFLVFISITLMLNKQSTAYNAELFKVDTGWGYDIELAGEIFVHQPFVPSLQRPIPFPNKKIAKKAANIVIEKLENGKMPTLTSEEIKNLGIFIVER